MGHAQKIRKPYGFTFINRKANLLQILHGDSSWLEIADIRIKLYKPIFSWAYHK
jgi:hypothetical protein